MIIDCHTHAFSEKIADKAVSQLINYYKMPTTLGGSLPDLLNSANEANLAGLILLVAATKPEQVKPAHDWILSLSQQNKQQLQEQYQLSYIPEIYCFGTFHIDDPNWESEINRLRAAGIKGIKLHPEFQGIDLADPRLNVFLEEIQRDFILMTHVGDPRVSPDNLSTPKKVASIARRFPKLRIIAAHLGGYRFWEEAYTDLAGSDVFIDTSSALSFIDQALLRQLISKHGVERILFGSDFPLSSPARELKLLEKISWLTGSEQELIRGLNCSRLLKG